ncbi:hypothetical protein ACHAW5_006330 [Stephanodiscus triporus]|uniref:Separase n=1 Tax=Stephanodiscus triporus TaxID=2934178 RepID=A0ABD3PU14_9STRA
MRRRREGTMSDSESATTTSDSNGDDSDDDEDASHGDHWSDDKDGGVDSEEEERRRVASMNRHRKRNGKITRRRRRINTTLLRRDKNGGDIVMSGSDNENDTSDDEVPLAILQLRKEQRRRLLAMRARERKLRDMNLMMNKRDDQIMKTNGIMKNKKCSRRTRPKNACALLGSLCMAASAMVTGEGDETVANDATKMYKAVTSHESDGASHHHLRHSHYPTNRIEEKNRKRNNDMFESDSSSTDDGMDTFADLRARATLSSTSSATADVDVNVVDVKAPGDDIDSGGNDGSDDNQGDYLLTPVEESDGEKSDDYLLTPREEYSEEDVGYEMIESDNEEKCKFKVREMEWGDLPNFIEELCAQVRDERISHVQNKLNELRWRLHAVKKRLSSRSPSLLTTTSATTSEEMMDALDKLSEESDELNRYIIEKLHRHGVDLCNIALTRLLSKRERRENEGKLTKSQKKLCRITAVDVWDVRVIEMCDLVKDIDSKVTSFQKEVEKELQSVADNIYCRTRNDDGNDTIPANGADGEGSGLQQLRKMKRTVERDSDDRHPHASRKRKSSSGRKASSLGLKQRKQHHFVRTRYFGGDPNRREDDANNYRLPLSLRDDATTGIEDEQSPPATALEEEVDSTTNCDAADDIDDDTRIPRSSANKQLSKRATPSASVGGTASGPQRQSRSISETMSGWLDKQQEGSEKGKKNSRWRSRGHGRSNRQASTNGNAKLHRASTIFSRATAHAQGQTGTQAANSPGTHRVLVSNGRLNHNQRQGGSKGSSKNDPATASSRPEIPHDLSADILFDSLPTNDSNKTVEQSGVNSESNGSIIDLCRDLGDRYPSSVPSSRDVLANLMTAVRGKSDDDLQKDEVVTIFQSLLYIFRVKCTTLLDIIQTYPEVASFHISCWCLVFHMLGKKSTKKIAQEDGLIFKIFANHTALAKHLLLQVVDVLYSQLLWEEYGQTPLLKSHVFDELRSLCVHIGSIIPLLPSVCGLLTTFGEPRWHLSLNHECKENAPETVLFVSAIDPEMHKRFIMSGDVPETAQDESRIRSFNHKIPREEIEAIWSIIGFSSCCATLTSQSAPDFKQPQMLLARLMFCDCGSLPNSDQQSPPSRLQVNTCRREIKWIDSLLSTRLLGDLPSMDSFLKQLIEKSVTLEAYDVVLSLLPSAPQAKVNTAVKQLWEYSCVDGASAVIGSELQADLMDMNSIFLANETNSVYRLSPSSVLLQRCAALAASYASMTMIKNTRWKSFRTMLQSLASGFVGKALEIENKVQCNAARIRTDDDYTAMFQSIIESATEIQIELSPTTSHLREAACYMILSGVVARSRHNASGEGNNFHLNRALRENIWRYSSDEKMRKHQQHFLDTHFLNKMGEAPASSSNICLLYTSSKSMAFTTLLHLYISDFNADPHQITERLHSHLVAVKADIEPSSMVYLLASIISNLLSTCDLLDKLNEKGRLSENEEKCKAHMNASKSCADIIRSITMHINLIFGRAKFILELMTKVAPPVNILLQLVNTIKNLGSSKFFRFVMESLTKALIVIVETASRNMFAKALSKDGCVETSFRSCLGAIRQAIALVHACGTDEMPNVQRAQSNTEWQAGADVYLSFVTTRLLPSVGNSNENGEHRKLCHSQSGGVLSVLAALCSILPLSGVYEILEPNYPIGDDCRFYLRQMATCFSSELLRLSKHSRFCKALVMQYSQKIFNYLFAALMDSDTLAMFPSSNLSLLYMLDGHNSRSKGNDLLSKAQNHLPLAPQDPDQESYKIKRMKGEYFDTVGPAYTSKNIWSFLENFGQVLASSSPYDIKCPVGTWQSFRSIGTKIVNICKTLQLDKDEDLRELLPQVSVERECLKRLIVFQALFAPLKNCSIDRLDTVMGGVCSVVSTMIIENLYYLSGIELELEEQRRIGCDDSDTRYQRAKALAFHRAYTELCGTLMTLMLRQNNNWESIIARDFVRLNLIASAFRGNLDLRRTIEEVAVKLNLCLRRRGHPGSSDGTLPLTLTEDLSMSFYRRTGDLLVYAAACGDKDNYRVVLFNAFRGFSSKGNAVIDAFITSVSSRLTLTPETIIDRITLPSDGLGRAMNNRMVSADVDSIDDLESMIELRDWVMNVFLVGRLGNDSTTRPCISMSLQLLTRMIKIFLSDEFSPRQKIYNDSGNLTSIATYTKLIHSLKECLCNSVRSNLDETFVAEFFCCARYFLALPYTLKAASLEKETVTLLSWVRASSPNTTDSNESSSHQSAYIYEVFVCLLLCGELLRHQETSNILRDFLIQMNNNEPSPAAKPNYIEIRKFCISFDKLGKLERDLSLKRTNSIQISNPYAGKSMGNTDIMSQKTFSGESLRAIDEYSNYLMSQTTMSEEM